MNERDPGANGPVPAAAEPRAAIVTGGTRGIGLGICKALLRRGISVAAVYRSDEASARAAAGEMAGLGGQCLTLKADVSRAAETARVVQEVAKRWGRVDILVNNAGIFKFAFLQEMDEAFLDEIYSANFKSAVLMITAALPWLRRSGEGRIINAGSIAGRLSDVGLVAYGCSKASIDMLTRIAAAELAPFGITVNAYSPGIIATEMTREMIEARGSEQVKQIPRGAFGVPADVAELVAFLCSRDAGYITGEVIGVDGGMLKVQNPARAWEFARGRTDT
jgi:3-oxoacyl-[acyl-carrier protein] reductase